MAKKKSTDITKTGALSYRDLQDLNSFNPENNVTLDDLRQYQQDNNILGSQQATAMQLGLNTSVSDYLEQSSFIGQETQAGNPDYFGRSAFDPGIVVGEQDWNRLSDVRAENQPWYSKLVNGIGKAGVLAATTALETAGLLYGVGEGIADAFNAEEGERGKAFLHGLWDNPITNALQNINEVAEEYMPNYYTRDEQEYPFGNIFTANFLGDKLLKNLGFMVGAFYGGIPASSAIGKLGVRSVKAARNASLAERAGMARRVGDLTAQYGDDVAGLNKALAAEHLTEAERGKRILEGFEKVKNAAQTTRATTQTIGALGSAINEGAIEAINNSKDWANLQIQKENERYQQELAEDLEAIEAKYGGTEMEDALKIQAQMDASEKHQRALAAIEKGRASMGNADLLLNIPVLMASNMYQLGRLYSRGFDSTRRQMGSFWNGHTLKGSLKEGTLATSRTGKGGIASALYKSNSEGLEEYLQRAASDGAGEAVAESIDRYLTTGKSEDSKTDVDDYIVGFGKAIAKNLGDPNAWEEYMIGALSSMVGMPVFGSQTKNAYIGKDSAFGFAGGIVGNYRDYMEAKDKEQKVAEYLNQRVKDPKFKKLYDTLRKNNDLDKLINGALDEDQKAVYKDLEYEKLFNDINAAASSGHLEEFRQLVGYNQEYSDEELQDIVKETSKTITADQQRKKDEGRKAFLEGSIETLNKEKMLTPSMKADLENYTSELEEVDKRLSEDNYQDKQEGPFIDVNGQMNVTDPDKMREILERNRKNLLESIDDYLKIRNEIDIETDGRLDDDQLSLLTMMKGKILDYDKRSAEMADDLVFNLQGIQGNYEKLREYRKEQAEKAQRLYDNTLKQLEGGKKDNAKKKELERLEQNHEEAKKKLNKAKAEVNGLENALKLLDMLLEEKTMTNSERLANSRGYGQGPFRGLVRGTVRPINSDEAQAILANPVNAMSLIHVIGNKASDLDSKQRQKLMQEVVDLSTLANAKTAYNKKVREFLGDPTKINEAFQESQDKITQQEKDNKSNDLSLRIQGARNMSELDNIMRDAYQINPEIAKAGLQKAKQEGDDNMKKFIGDYEQASSFFGDFSQQASKLPDDIREGIMGTAASEWEIALADGVDPYDKFIQGLNEAADVLEKDANPVAKQTAEAMKKILSDLDAAKKSVATNKTTKKATKKEAGDDEKSTGADASAAAGMAALRKRKAEAGKPAASPAIDTKDSLSKDIENEITQSREVATGLFTVNSLETLSQPLKDRIAKYNEEHADNPITDDTILDILDKVVDDSISNDLGNVSVDDAKKKGDDIEIGDDGDGNERAERMHENLRVTFKSDRVTAYRFNLDFRIPYKAETEQQEAIQKLLEQYRAYQFLDKNYLGYVARELEHPEIHFLKSTDPAVDGNGTTESAIFVAIKWDNNVEKAIRKHAFNDRTDVNIADEVNLVTIGGEQYQILGVATFNQSDADPNVQQAFAAFQSSVNHELNGLMDDARAAGDPFVISSKTSAVDAIYTGRLEKRNEERDTGEKVSLYDFMTSQQGDSSRRTSTEWSSGMDFYFGTVVNGNLNTVDDQVVTDQMEPVNDIWAGKNNGAILLYVPKPDGRLYPVRCTRRTVRDWLNKTDNGYGMSGSELIGVLMNPDPANPVSNDYLGNIILYLSTLFDTEATIGDRTNAKVMLSKYFIFGYSSPVHFNNDEVTLTFENRKHNISGETVEERIQDFFNVLSQENVMFTLPSPSIEDINGRGVISSGVFEIGLRGFYNFNANFTIYPIDGNGELVKPSVDSPEGSQKGGGNVNQTDVEFDLGDGLKTYTILGDGTVMENGLPVSSEKQYLITYIRLAQQKELPEFKMKMLSASYNNPEIKKFVSDGINGFDGIYIIHSDDGDWIYDTRKADHNARLYKADSSEGVQLMKDFNQAKTAFSQEHMLEIKKLKDSKHSTPGSQPQAPTKPSPEAKPSVVVPPSGQPQVTRFAGKTVDDLDSKGTGLESILASNKNDRFVKEVFKLLQQAEEGGYPINDALVEEYINKGKEVKGSDEKKKLLADLREQLICKGK